MKKKIITSLELAALVDELQFIVGGRIQGIYQPDKEEIILQLHVPRKGKTLLRIVPGKLLCLTENKKERTNPSGFCMLLRKYLMNSFVEKVEQKNDERIVTFEFDTLDKEDKHEEKIFLIAELFGRGNLLLVDSKKIIIGNLQNQKENTQRNQVYEFPAEKKGWSKITEKELLEHLRKSDKRNLAAALATEIGLGGIYAEEACFRSGLDKEMKPAEITIEETRKIISSLEKMKEELKAAKGFIYKEEITPFPLQILKEEEMIILPTYNQAINTINPFQIVSPYEKKIQAIQRMITEQEEAIGRLEEDINTNSRKGELIYEKYAALQKLLDIVQELKKNHDWQEIAQELRKERKIRDVDLKNKKVTIDL